MAGHVIDQFYENNERAKRLSNEYFDIYNKLLRHLLKQNMEYVKIDILLEHILQDLINAQEQQQPAQSVIGKHFKDYIKAIEKQIDFKTAYKRHYQKDYDKWVFSAIWYTICSYLVLLFVKGIFGDRYFISFSFDAIVAIFAFYLGGSNLYQHYKIIKRYHLRMQPLYIEIGAFIFGCISVVLTISLPYDVSFLILVIGYVITKRTMKQVFEKLMDGIHMV